MRFDEVLRHRFPGAMPASDFVSRSYQLLLGHGFSAPGAIACVGVCRDEMTRPFVDKIEDVWGASFNFSALGGMLFLGRTGFQAAHSHAPLRHGRARYVYYLFPHIAIDDEGHLGRCYRDGRPEPSLACGALQALLDEMRAGEIDLGVDRDDIEQSLLKRRLAPSLRSEDHPDLATLTHLAHGAGLEDLEHMIALTVDAGSDYAVLTGVLIHGLYGRDYVWPGTLYVVVEGRHHALDDL